jgi:hypothetical protein
MNAYEETAAVLKRIVVAAVSRRDPAVVANVASPTATAKKRDRRRHKGRSAA